MSIALTKTEKENVFRALEAHAQAHELFAVRYLELGVCTIRVLCYAADILPILEKQFGYVLRDEAARYDATMVVWKETESARLAERISRLFPPPKRIKARAEMLILQSPSFCLEDAEDPEAGVLGWINNCCGTYTEVFDDESRIGYFCCESFEPERFVKHGHAFVRLINRLIKTDTVNLTHGAVFGYGENGFLLCGRGKRGKSTLTIESMLQGFDYVSDDYQILERKTEGLFAYPIYSIVTLSYRMYNEMYDRFRGKFVCNNFTQDKYIFNISEYYPQFRAAYPVNMCLFPEIVADAHPSIVPCNAAEKGRAIVQLIHSTLDQMSELGNTQTARKLLDMVRDMPFFKFNLCNCVPENTEYLRQYLLQPEPVVCEAIPVPDTIMDVTYGLGVILDTRSCRFTALNKLATALFTELQMGVEPSALRAALGELEAPGEALLKQFDRFMDIVVSRGYMALETDGRPLAQPLTEIARRSGYTISVHDYIENTIIELIK